tara:strand:- start:1443 stop:1901 length:459 start_codon:yes stop_codon:yes gene_type:complete
MVQDPIENVNEKDIEMAKDDIDQKIADLTDEDVTNWFGDDLEEDYIDNTLLDIRRGRSLLMFWHQLNTELSNIREGYILAKKWDDEELKQRYIEQGKPQIKRMKILEGEVKENLEKLRDKRVFTQQELILLPKWMLKILDVKIEEDDVNQDT